MNWSQIAIYVLGAVMTASPALKVLWQKLPSFSLPKFSIGGGSSTATTTKTADRVAQWETLLQSCENAGCKEATKHLKAMFQHLAGDAS
jgi:hypothetical protein